MMKNSMKGALLSGLVFPGLGQIALKRYRRGFALMLTVMATGNPSGMAETASATTKRNICGTV